MRRTTILSALLIVSAALFAGCSGTEIAGVTSAPPTKTPKPTFTPTPDWTPTLVVFDTATPDQPTATVEAAPGQTETAVPSTARLTANQTVNVRTGPGTTYPAIGRLSSGDSFDIAGKNPAGDWLQFDLEGRTGWVFASLVSISGDTDAVQVAQNIAPPPTSQPRPTARPVVQPQPTAPPQPTAAPQRRYEFNIALVQACRPQAAGNWFEGTVYKGGAPFNGARVVFSYTPDGPWSANPQISGPHEGYTNWNAGYYSHIINASGPKAGSWYVWIVNEAGQRISEIANWQSTGEGAGCNEAVIDFDSR